jgi:hypothetical protein
VLDFGIGALMIYLLGWHWEFLPSFVAKLVPGVDLVPFWTMAVANVYRKSKRIAVAAEESRENTPVNKDLLNKDLLSKDCLINDNPVLEGGPALKDSRRS